MKIGLPLIVVLASVQVACASHEDRARQLLERAKRTCGLESGIISFEGTSDDPDLLKRRDPPGPMEGGERIYVAHPGLLPSMTDCMNKALADGGYRMERMVTHDRAN